jgi:uncharacterized protein YndB with AHSA1/START domain
MMNKILMVLAVVVVILLGVIATRPATFHIERSASIAAPADIVYAQISDFHQWANWSPWDKLDPQLKRTFEGAASGTGAGYSWIGNDKVGEGRMTITESKPSERVEIKLEFIKPYAATNKTEFTLKPSGSNTSVTWAMSGENGFMAKAMSLFMDMEKMIGPDFEKGLAGIKEISEADAKKRASAQAAAPMVAPAAAIAPAPTIAAPAPAAGHP